MVHMVDEQRPLMIQMCRLVAALLLPATVVVALSSSDSSIMAVPARMALSRSLASSLPVLYNAELIRLNIEENVVKEDPIPTTLKEVLAKSFENKPSVCFVVRRPG